MPDYLNIVITTEDVDYFKAFNDFVEQMKEIAKDTKEEYTLEYYKDVKHEMIFPKDGSNPIHRLSWRVNEIKL